MTENEEPALRRLKVDLGEVAFAMGNASYEMRHSLDVKTGEVVFIGDEIQSEGIEPVGEEG